MRHLPGSRARAPHSLIIPLAALLLAPTLAADPTPPLDTHLEHVYYDHAQPDGSLDGGATLLPRFDPSSLAPADAPPAPSTTLLHSGPVANRIDLVFLGDGYTAPQLPLYAFHVQNAFDALFNTIPFKYYRSYFNVHRVDVVSNEAGVDNDPPPVLRDTALDMTFWCNNIERLLCVDVAKAYAFAANAPDFQHIFAIANSARHGGAAYPVSRVITLAGSTPLAGEIALHELGHTLANLADEYSTGGPVNYTGPERSEPNASIRNAETMTADGAKWHLWLRELGGVLDGPVDTYLGCYYSSFGIYRPSPNSRMRALLNPYNAPSVEALVVSMYRTVRPIDAISPPLSTAVPRSAILTVTPLRPVVHALTIQWYVDGIPVPNANTETLDLSSIPLAPNARTVSVRVRDDTPLVRDPAARDQFLTQTATWNIIQAPCPADVNGDGRVDFLDLNIVLVFFGQPVGIGGVGDINGDGRVDFLDLNILLADFGRIC